MLDFPSNPSVGDVYQTWKWNGVAWVSANAPYLPLGGGSLSGPMFLNANAAMPFEPVPLQQLQSWPLAGVVDGSNAAPGEIGELITNYTFTGSFALSNSPTMVGTLALTPGDWDVCATVRTGNAAALVASDISVWITTTNGGWPDISIAGAVDEWAIAGTTAAFGYFVSMPVGPMRISTTAATTIYAGCIVNGTGGPITVATYMRARRMR